MIAITRRLTPILVALLLGSAAGVVAAAGSAAAAACPAGQGVTVVVGSSVSCDANGGGSAGDNFRDAGHSLTMVDRQPGFVCRVDGVPEKASCVNTPPADAYWGLFWSDGTSGTWKYASQGAGGLSVPAGGWVGFAFQNSDARTPPGVTPKAAAPAAKPTAAPTAKPKPKPASKPVAKPTAATPTARAAAPSASASALAPTPGASASPTATPPAATPTPTPSAPATDQPQAASTPDVAETADPANAAKDSDSSDGSGPLPLVAGLLVLALVGGMGAVLWRRKAAGGSS